MDKRIHWSKVWPIMENRDPSTGRPVPFAIKYVKLSTGELKHYPHCELTSFHSKGDTLNVLLLGETRPRTLKRVLIVEFNNKKVYI